MYEDKRKRSKVLEQEVSNSKIPKGVFNEELQ